MSWWHERMLTIDFETTSAEPEDARIVSAAMAWVGGGQATDAWACLVDAGVEIPAEATEVHGISTERMREEGMSPRPVLLTIAQALQTARDEHMAVVVFNARYDLTVLAREFVRYDLPSFVELVLGELLVVDPIVIERHLDRYRPKRVASHSLEDCCRVWNVVLDGAHDATFDAIAAARLAWRLAENGRVIRRVRDESERAEFVQLAGEWDLVRQDLPELVEWQRRIAWVEAERLEAYFREGDPRKGVPAQPDRVVAREWPIIPVLA